MRFFRPVLPALGLAALLLLGSCGKPIGTTGDGEGFVEGIVEDAKSGDPIEGAVVKAGKEIELTSPDGKYKLKLAPGGYRISVSKEGYDKYLSPAEVKVEAEATETHDVRLKLPVVDAPVPRIDKAPPSVTKERNVDFVWSLASGGSEGGKVVYATLLDGLEGPYSGLSPETKRSFKDLKDGKYTFKVKARDTKTGTEGEPVEHAFEVDGTPPLNPSIVPAEGEEFIGSRAVDLVVTAEGASEVALWEGREPTMLSWSPFRDRKQLVLTKSDGEKIIFAKFKDAAGNVSENVSCTVILDREPPTRPGNVRGKVLDSNEVRLTWNASKDEGSGVATYTVLRDGIEIGKTRDVTFVDRRPELGSEYAYSVSATDKLDPPPRPRDSP
ncbi:MAG: carboxypeptidase regulatory-like domain-containing protein [Planctomycetota bacterium]|jgi:hypothetical protein